MPALVNNKPTEKPSAQVKKEVAATSGSSPRPIGPQFANSTPAIPKSTPAVAKASVAPAKEPEVRRAEPVKPEDLANAGVPEKSEAKSEVEGPNQVAIKPLKKTYIKVVVDNGSNKPAFERWISPSDGTVEFRGQKISVRVLDRDAVRINKNGKPVSGDDEDVTVE